MYNNIMVTELHTKNKSTLVTDNLNNISRKQQNILWYSVMLRITIPQSSTVVAAVVTASFGLSIWSRLKIS
jgi:hypothetical protein